MHVAANLGRHFPAALRKLFSWFRKFSRSLCLYLCSARNNHWNNSSLLPAGNQILCNRRQFIWRWGNTLGYTSRFLQNDSQHCTCFSHLLFWGTHFCNTHIFQQCKCRPAVAHVDYREPRALISAQTIQQVGYSKGVPPRPRVGLTRQVPAFTMPPWNHSPTWGMQNEFSSPSYCLKASNEKWNWLLACFTRCPIKLWCFLNTLGSQKKCFPVLLQTQKGKQTIKKWDISEEHVGLSGRNPCTCCQNSTGSPGRSAAVSVQVWQRSTTQFVSQIRTDKFNESKRWTESASNADSSATKKRKKTFTVKGK